MKVSIDKNQLDDTQAMLSGLRLDGPKILSRSLNKTVAKGRTVSSRKIRDQVKLKASYVRGKLKISRATYKKLSSKLSAEKRGLLLTNFVSGVDGNNDFKIKIKPVGRAKTLKGAFLTTVYAGGRPVDVIARPMAGYFKTGNAKMEVLYGPSVSQVFSSVRDDVDSELVDFLLTATNTQIETALRGY